MASPPTITARKQEGFGPMEMTVWKGRRWSAANAYLRPALKRPNVWLRTGTRAERIVFEGRRAVGVVASRWGHVETLTARKEVIVAASAINSPQLLMLSGIGPAEHLRAHGIEVVANRPGVGGNLQDHLEVYVQQACMQPITLNAHLGLLARARIGLEWLVYGGGLGATNHFEACAFIRSDAGVPYPDLQLHFLPAAVRYDGRAAAAAHGFQVHIGPMRSPSRGEVRLKSPAPGAAPSIRFNYMSAEEDWRDFRTAIRLTREIFAQPAFDEYRGGEIAPGDAAQSDEALDDFVRENVESAYHPCGTCRMGAADDVASVVDPECRVIGTQGLRVVDSSIFPEITNGNINAPSIMVGEKAADMILGKAPLPASNSRRGSTRSGGNGRGKISSATQTTLRQLTRVPTAARKQSIHVLGPARAAAAAAALRAAYSRGGCIMWKSLNRRRRIWSAPRENALRSCFGRILSRRRNPVARSLSLTTRPSPAAPSQTFKRLNSVRWSVFQLVPWRTP